jgi:hypothetical protein
MAPWPLGPPGLSEAVGGNAIEKRAAIEAPRAVESGYTVKVLTGAKEQALAPALITRRVLAVITGRTGKFLGDTDVSAPGRGPGGLAERADHAVGDFFDIFGPHHYLLLVGVTACSFSMLL